MERVFPMSWSNRILFMSVTSVTICSTIQAYVSQLSVPLHFLISWAIFVIAMSIWVSCVTLRMMLKVNAPVAVEPFNKWVEKWVKDYSEHGQQKRDESLEKIESIGKTNGVHTANVKSDDYLSDLSSNGTLEKRSDKNDKLPLHFVAKMNLNKIVEDVDSNFVKVWYRNVSNDDAFPSEVNQLLRNLLNEVNYQITRVNRIELAKKIGNILLLHLKEYRRALRRVEKGTTVDIEDAYRYVHPGSRSQAALEHSLYRVVTVLAREFLQWELTSSLPCKLLFSILAKKLLLGIEVISSPEWILKAILMAMSSKPMESEESPTANESFVSSALGNAMPSTIAAAMSRPLPKPGQTKSISTDSKIDSEDVRSALEKRASLSLQLEGLEMSHRGLWANVEISEPDSEPEEDKLSPVYEEPTDFATTIARLRSLLHQKSNATTPLQMEEKSCTVYEGSHLTIPWTEFHTAPDGSQQLLYCIQFDDIEQTGSHFFETTTATVKRQHSDFVQLHASLEEVPSLAAVLTDLSLPEGGRVEMENYLKQLCSRMTADYPPQLRHFLRPSSSNKKADTVAPRLDRFLAKTVSGVFNTLKTVVPGFEMDPEIEVMPMPTLMSLADVPWRFVEDLKSNLQRELQQLVAERIDYCSVDTAYEAVDSVEGSGDSELLAHWWEIFNTPYDEELEELDSSITLTQIAIDLVSEVLVGAGCNNIIEQEAVVRTIKLFLGNIAESSIQNSILKSFRYLEDQDIITSSVNENTEGLNELKDRLLQRLISTVPSQATIFLGDNETSEAFKFLMKSLENKKINRDLCLQLLDVSASQLLAASRSNHQARASY